MDGVVAYYLVRSMDYESKSLEATSLEAKPLEIKPLGKVLYLYKYPKRDNLCSECGQQLTWCVCYLNDYQ